MVSLPKIKAIAEREFADIVVGARLIDAKVRVILHDTSYIDFWWSLELPGRFAYHWQRKHVDDTIYRHDNAPHTVWAHISTFPRYYHRGSESNVVASFLPADPEVAVREFLEFARQILSEREKSGPA
jgi:hypothetical protein